MKWWIGITGFVIVALLAAIIFRMRTPTAPPTRFAPAVVSIAQSNAPMKVLGGVTGVFFILPDGSLWCWGIPGSHVLPRATVPQQVGTNTDWVDAYAANNHCLGLRRDGSLWEWGWRGGGLAPLPERVNADLDWIGFAAGDVHSVALKRDGTIWAWGINSNGQLGGPAPDRTNALQVGKDNDWAAVGCGQGSYTLGIKSNGTLWVWGNVYQFLNRSGPATLPLPTQICRETNWLRIRGHLVENRAGELWYPFAAFPQAGRSATEVCGLVASMASEHHPAAFVGEFRTYRIAPDSTLMEGRLQDRFGPQTVQSWRRLGKRSDWISLWEAGGSVIGLTRDGTIWAWGLDHSEEPVPDLSSSLKRLRIKFAKSLGLPLPASTTTSALPVYREEPRPIMRIVCHEKP